MINTGNGYLLNVRFHRYNDNNLFLYYSHESQMSNYAQRKGGRKTKRPPPSKKKGGPDPPEPKPPPFRSHCLPRLTIAVRYGEYVFTPKLTILYHITIKNN